MLKNFQIRDWKKKKTLFKVLNQKDYDEWKKSQNDNNNSNFNEDVTNDFLDPNKNRFTNMNVFNGFSSSYIHGFK